MFTFLHWVFYCPAGVLFLTMLTSLLVAMGVHAL